MVCWFGNRKPFFRTSANEPPLGFEKIPLRFEMRQGKGQGEFFFALGFWVDRMLSGRLAVGSWAVACAVACFLLSGPGPVGPFAYRVTRLPGHGAVEYWAS